MTPGRSLLSSYAYDHWYGDLLLLLEAVVAVAGASLSLEGGGGGHHKTHPYHVSGQKTILITHKAVGHAVITSSLCVHSSCTEEELSKKMHYTHLFKFKNLRKKQRINKKRKNKKIIFFIIIQLHFYALHHVYGSVTEELRMQITRKPHVPIIICIKIVLNIMDGCMYELSEHQEWETEGKNVFLLIYSTRRLF
jgi:hypothetical protein